MVAFYEASLLVSDFFAINKLKLLFVVSNQKFIVC